MDAIWELVIFQIKEAYIYLQTAFKLAAVCSIAVLAGLSVCLAFHNKPTLTVIFRFVFAL
ncbi:MAG: hypothetical protein K2O59_08965 [Lachnospiraceae bacterium]|nr:hypothetical protein [Lachnospiraceae bacterium]